jgi:DNA recombination protein RmuC
MDLTSLFIGLPLGIIIGYLMFSLLSRGKSVAKADYDSIHQKWNDACGQLSLSEEKLRSQVEQYQSLQQRHSVKEAEFNTLLSRTASLETSVKNYDERLRDFSTSLAEEKRTNQLQQTEINKHLQALAEITANNRSLQEKLESHKQEILEMQKTSHLQFEKLANQIFEEKSGKFTEFNKTNMEAILKPLNENIESFKKKVDETYDKESKERFSLGEKVKDLIENTNKVSQEANNLATALKGQTKKQGDWGETILENILERSGLVKNREYFVQENFKDEYGNNVRPDITIHLPGNRKIIVDSKVSLLSYTRFCDSDNKEEQELQIKSYIKSLRAHIDQLSEKKYDELTSSLEFVVMFVPIEPAYLLAIQYDPEISEYASKRKIMMISPNNLIAVLKIVSDLWKREFQNRNALEIASQGKSLYEKFVVFVESLEDIGKHLTKSQDSYHRAISQLKDGRGNLINQANKLKKLGIKSLKEIPPAMIPLEDAEEDEIGFLPGGMETDSELRPSE